MLDLKALLSKILDAIKVDYVVEEGTSGQWIYRKWNSGVLEQWYQGNPGTYTVNTQRGNMYSGGNMTYTFPVEFVGYPTVVSGVTLSTDAYVVLAQEKGHSATSITIRIVAGSSVSANQYYTIHIYAVGKWK